MAQLPMSSPPLKGIVPSIAALLETRALGLARPCLGIAGSGQIESSSRIVGKDEQQPMMKVLLWGILNSLLPICDFRMLIDSECNRDVYARERWNPKTGVTQKGIPRKLALLGVHVHG